MEKIHVYERDAYYYETDKMSVVHHSNYIRWFEEARVNFMKKVGYPYDFMESQGIMMPVLSAQCSYKNSVHFGDTVLIYASISKFNGFKMEVQYKICDPALARRVLPVPGDPTSRAPLGSLAPMAAYFCGL